MTMLIALYITAVIMSVVYGDDQIGANTLKEGGVFAFLLMVTLWILYVPVMLIYDIIDMFLWVLSKFLPEEDE